MGGLVIVQSEHQGDTYFFVYGHMASVSVTEGDKVELLDLLGRQGNTGRSDGDHLHFAVNKDGTRNVDTGEITGGVWFNALKYMTEPGGKYET